MMQFWNKWFTKAEPQFATLRPFGVNIPVGPEQTLLEAALAKGVPFPHSCTVGTCASCKCKLLSGEVRMGVDFGYTLSKEELQAGYILACQAHPLSALVVEVEGAGADAPPPSQFTGKIKCKTPLTGDILAVKVELDRPIKYAAGQFATLQAGAIAPRSYSFADAPDRKGRTEVTFFIRKAPGGAFTEPLFADTLDRQDLVVDGPHGAFFLRAGEVPMICIAGSSGLAPLMSLLSDARKKNIRRPCVLLFGARTQTDLYMLDAIEAIERDWLAEFKFVPVLSEAPERSSWAGRRGFVTDALGEILAAADAATFANAQSYMCGPPPMIDRAISILTGGGMDLSQIHYDKFTDARPALAMAAG
jgi:p-cymene monooxygenase electron transfer component